jgi:hypothetical protein
MPIQYKGGMQREIKPKHKVPVFLVCNFFPSNDWRKLPTLVTQGLEHASELIKVQQFESLKAVFAL